MTDATMLASIEVDGSAEALVQAVEALQAHEDTSPLTYAEDGAGKLLRRVSLWRNGTTTFVTFS